MEEVVENKIRRTGLTYENTGQPVFVLATTVDMPSTPIEILDPAQILGRFNLSTHIVDRSFEAVVKAYFRLGGSRLLLLPVRINPEAEDLNAEYRSCVLGADEGFGKRRGFFCLRDYDSCGDLICFPQAGILLSAEELASFMQFVQGELSRRHQHFLLVDTPCFSSSDKVLSWSEHLSSDFSAIFFPWISLPGLGALPASVAAACLIQWSDEAFGISQSPANREFLGPLALVSKLEPLEIERLNQARVNILREKTNQEVILWGSSTSARSDRQEESLIECSRALWAIRDSIERIAESFLLESRNSETCVRLERALTAFLERCVKEGILVSAEASKSFEVTCELSSHEKGQWDSSIRVSLAVALESPNQLIRFKQDLR